ncbi:hypothetical protein GQ53DRAFT_821049 [Thozetella sp. PMI_491]|nr:hypothetical protein GQ53DRAFT_821049 [Thozetella sp. PMI_491]
MGSEQAPAPAPSTLPKSTGSTKATSTTSGMPGSIQAVIVRCDGEKARFAPWSTTMVQADHPVFSNSVPPVPGRIEVPLVFHRVGTRGANKFTMLHLPSAPPFDSTDGVVPWRTCEAKNGENHHDEMDDLMKLWNSEYDKFFVASLARTGVKSELIDPREVEGYHAARFLEFSRIMIREGWRFGWKRLLQGNYTAGVLEEKKKSFWELFEKRSASCMTSIEAVAFRAELEDVLAYE